MNEDAAYIYNELNRYIVLMRTEKDMEVFQSHLDEFNRLVKELYDLVK